MADPTQPPDLLFAYGTLAPADESAAAQGGWLRDAVRGRLYDLGPFPMLFDPDDPEAGWVEGWVRPVDCVELTRDLDPYEGVDEGLYVRLDVSTRAGRHAWVYIGGGPVPEGAKGPIPRWDGPRGGAAAPRPCRGD